MFNNMLMGAAGQSLSGAGGFVVNNSALFNEPDDEYFTRTPSSASNQRTWTFSTWIKRGKLGSDQRIFTATNNGCELFFDANDKLNSYQYTSGSYVWNYISTQLFRDPHAWYNIVVRIDTTQATASNRVRLYVNGEQIEDFDTSTAPSQNATGFVNSAVAHYIGRYSGSNNMHYDGYLAETVLIDGQSLGPTSFGEKDDNGVWRPIDLDGSGLFTVSSTAEAIANVASGKTNSQLTTYTYSSVALGTASATRAIYVFVTAQEPGTTAPDVSSLTVGGVSGTRVADVSNSAEPQYYVSELWRADVPSGTTGDIVVTWNTPQSRCGVIAWAVTGDHSLFDIKTELANTSASLAFTDVPDGSVILAGRGGTGGKRITWGSDVTENIDEDIEPSGVCHSGASSAKSTGGNFTVTCARTDGTTDLRPRTVALVLSPTQGAGINGFYLNMAASGSDLGDDASGKSNDFTNTNSVTQTTDTCTDNHATFSPLLSNASKVTLSEGNMRGATSTSSGHVGLILSGFELPTSGKYYWEWVTNTVGTTPSLGWRSIENLNPNGHTSGGNNQAEFITGNDYNTGSGRILSSTIDGSTSLSQAAYGNFLTVSGGNPLANGTVLGCAYDANNGLAWFSYNNTWVDGNGTDSSSTVKGEIEAGTSGSQAFTTANGAVGEAGLFIMATVRSVSSGNFSLRTRSDQWTGDCPSGFTALSTKNQAAAITYAIEDGSSYFNTILYGGSNSQQAITGVGFTPDWFWIKNRTSTSDHTVLDTVRAAGKLIYPSQNNVQDDSSAHNPSLDSDGLTLGGNYTDINKASNNYVLWNWKAGDSNTVVSASGSGDGAINACTHRANQTAGFSIVKYEGANSQISNSEDTKVTHGLGAKPELAIIKNIDATDDWMVLSTSTSGFASDSQTGDDAHLHLNTDDSINGSLFTGHFETGSDSTHFEVGNEDSINTNGENYIAYVFRSIPGFSKVGSYTGGINSTNGVYVSLGFRPAWLMLKNYTNSGESWYVFDNLRPGYNDENNQLIPNSTGTEGAGNILDLLSNGFKIRANDRAYGGSSASDGYLYLAFAENPFAGTTPATAR